MPKPRETADDARTAPAPRRLARAAAAGLLLIGLAFASPSAAHDHDVEEVGNPIRLAAYVLHPVGVALDYLIFRPAHWLVSFEPLSTLFGHEPDDDVPPR